MPDSVKAAAPTEPPVVQMTDISITFPGVKALDGVDFRMFPGEVHSLMGENGAGKSTLIKALTGVYSVDSGVIRLGGEQVTFAGPAQAQAAGLEVVNVYAFGHDYAETLKRWRERFLAQREAVLQGGFDERFMRIWEFYLAYCEAAFMENNIDVLQVTLQKRA